MRLGVRRGAGDGLGVHMNVGIGCVDHSKYHSKYPISLQASVYNIRL